MAIAGYWRLKFFINAVTLVKLCELDWMRLVEGTLKFVQEGAFIIAWVAESVPAE